MLLEKTSSGKYLIPDKLQAILKVPEPSQDIYLYNAAKMGKLGYKIREVGYDPDNPTPEAIAKAKKACKAERYIAKRFTLASNYGAGAGKIHQALTMDGVDVTLSECKDYHRAFWKLYEGIRLFSENLQRLHTRNGGWIYNGFKRPLPIEDKKIKDIVNRFIQSTGHDVLVRYIYLLEQELKNITWYPWIIDFHDETMIEVPNQHVFQATEAFIRAGQRLNEELNWDVPMTGAVEVGDTLADFKCEE